MYVRGGRGELGRWQLKCAYTEWAIERSRGLVGCLMIQRAVSIMLYKHHLFSIMLAVARLPTTRCHSSLALAEHSPHYGQGTSDVVMIKRSAGKAQRCQSRTRSCWPPAHWNTYITSTPHWLWTLDSLLAVGQSTSKHTNMSAPVCVPCAVRPVTTHSKSFMEVLFTFLFFFNDQLSAN